MAIQNNDNIQNNSPKATDNRAGRFTSGVWRAYNSLSEANTTINPFYRHRGLTVAVNIGGFDVEYIYKDGITDNHLVPKGNIRIMGTGSDMTSSLNTLLAVSSVSSITFGSSQNTGIIINGTLNAGSKQLIFEHGSFVTGTGTISGGIINAPSFSNIFDYSINLSEVRSIDNVFWCEWFGAVGNNSTDNTTAIQKAATYICNNNVGAKNLRIGPGIFRIQKGINFFRDTNNNGDPEFVNFTFKGNLKGYEFTGNETLIRCMHSDNFGINVQRGKGFVLDGFGIEGTNQLNYSVNTAWGGASYNLGVRSNSQSPYSALVLDAFGSGTSGSNRYPGFESFYAGIVGNGGSTDGTITNIAINGFYVGIILSPNFNTQNNEAHTFDSIWFNNVRDGFVTTNSQERTVRCGNFKFWNSTHTCVTTTGYGASRGEVPLINVWNIAGNVYQLFNLRGAGGYFPVVTIKDFYAENFYWMGVITGIVCKMRDCHFAFSDLKSVIPGQKQQTFMYVSQDIEFDNCIMFWYNGAEKVPLNVYGRSRFINCYLSNPVAYADNNWTHDMYAVEYINTRFYCEVGNTSQSSFESYGLAYSALAYGAQAEVAMLNKEYCSYRINTYDLNSANYFAQYRRIKSPHIRRIPIGDTVTVTVSGTTATISGSRKFDPPAGSIIYAQNLTINNGLVNASGYAVMRAVTGNTFDRVIEGMVSGTYKLYYIQMNLINQIGFCDVDSSGAITNAVKEGQTSAWDMGGGYKLFSNLLQFVNSSSGGTAQLSYNNNLGNADGVIVSDYEYEEWGTSYSNPLNNPFVNGGVAFTAGSFYKNIHGAAVSQPVGADTAIGWMCIKSGVKGSPVPPVFIEQQADGSYT